MTAAAPGTQVRRRARAGRGVGLLALTCALYFAVTGIGVFEGRVVYPSWLTLADFPGFAAHHSAYGTALLPWLPAPLLLATALTAVLLYRCPAAVPRWAVGATLAAQLVVLGVTAALALPIQGELATPGHSPAEIRALIEQLIGVNPLREVPGLATAAALGWMLHRVLAARPDREA
jgi:hypothetical protein